MRLFIQPVHDQDTLEIECREADSIGHIKATLAHRLRCSMAQLRLIFAGQQLDQDFQLLSESGITNESCVSLLMSSSMSGR